MLSLKVKTDGLAKLSQKLKAMQGTQSITLGELMPPEFISACSEFQNIQALFDASPFKIETPEDLAAIPDADWDVFIAKSTTYSSWEDMRHAASAEWTKRKLRD